MHIGFVACGEQAEQGKPVEVRRRRATVMCQGYCQNAIAEKWEGGSAAQSQETYKTMDWSLDAKETVRSHQCRGIAPDNGGTRCE